MPNVSIGANLEAFIEQQLEHGRYQNASEVVRAGLRLLQEHELDVSERAARLAREINTAFDEGGDDVGLDEAFDRLDKRHAGDLKADERGA